MGKSALMWEAFVEDSTRAVALWNWLMKSKPSTTGSTWISLRWILGRKGGVYSLRLYCFPVNEQKERGVVDIYLAMTLVEVVFVLTEMI